MNRLFAAFLFFSQAALHAQLKLDQNTTITFASVAEGQKILTTRDDFVERLSPFDRSARLKTDKIVSESKYLKFVGKNILQWDDSEKRKMNSALQGIKKNLVALSLPLPDKVLIIKTTGKEEGGAAYTRANAIVFPQSKLSAPIGDLQKTICHELFHIISRKNPILREKFYTAIGFSKCHEVEFPPELKPRKITNPDAPRNDHTIQVEISGDTQWAIPILFSDREKYDTTRGGEFFNYLQFKLLLVERPNNGLVVKPMAKDRKPILVDVGQVSGFFEQVGKNTGYIIHPEEILADNFALLAMGESDLPSPKIVEKIQGILKNRKATD